VQAVVQHAAINTATHHPRARFGDAAEGTYQPPVTTPQYGVNRARQRAA
jgi:hypothetical protein